MSGRSSQIKPVPVSDSIPQEKPHSHSQPIVVKTITPSTIILMIALVVLGFAAVFVTMEKVKKIIETLRARKIDLYDKDWLRTWDLTQDEIHATLEIAEALKILYKENIDCSCFSGALAVSQFRDNSTRTRFSFAKAATLLGLTVSDLDEKKSQIAHGETVRETSNMISFLTEVIGIRDDKFVGKGHTYQVEVAKSVDAGFKEGVLPQRPSIVNLQCDEDHPTQSMSDLAHLVDHFGGVENLKGKKICMSWGYSPSYGKPLSVPQGIIALLPRFGADVHLCYPEGYDLLPHVMEEAKKQAEIGGGKLSVHSSMEPGLKDADVAYVKSWAPASVMIEKAALIDAGFADGTPQMDELEKKALAENAKHMDWEYTEELAKLTKPGADTPDCLAMHCLPADITGVSCKHGEFAASVFDRHRVAMYKEAQWKPYIIASMMMITRFKDSARILDKIVERKKPRKME
ncbi:Putative carbamoyltransferase YgeW [Aduncisulcus paluster]|uniref:ornithine carbamoyltransferase n=2 Tax=Aduncisulcus paluster TaxID=2918883 RepID=A0ABQ5KXT2_9EUKA|nr:Putative carbamoyltransferase YgeW [Aduncisulcus paluster]